MSTVTRPNAVIELAAKYICNYHCGRCPMMIVTFPCPSECNLDTIAWQCWIKYFQNLADKAGDTTEHGMSSLHDNSTTNSHV